jgi:hypothetical protein
MGEKARNRRNQNMAIEKREREREKTILTHTNYGTRVS